MKRLSVALVCAAVALSACKEKKPPETVQDSTDPLPTLPEPEKVEPTVVDGMVTELGLDAVTTPGSVHGVWELQRRDGVKVATLYVRHDVDQPKLAGVVKMADGAVTDLNPSSQFLDEKLIANWEVDYEGRSYRFNLTDGQVMPDGRIRLRLAEQRDGAISDAYLVPKKG